MKQLSCRDMGADCDFVAKGNTVEEVKNNMLNHTKMEHGDMMNGMSSEKKDEMIKKMDATIKDV